jgi:hypothetical protein
MASRGRIEIPGSIKFNARAQIDGLYGIQKDGFIEALHFMPSRTNSKEMIFIFKLCRCHFTLLNGDRVEKDFSNYKIKVQYGGNAVPKVFVTSHRLSPTCKHLYPDGSLCLYKPANFKWTNSNSLSRDIVTLIYAWLYFYEVWLGDPDKQWYGDEAKH